MRLAETRIDLGLIAAKRGGLDEAVDLGVQALASQRKSGNTLGRVAELDTLLQRGYADAAAARDFHARYLAARRQLQETAS